MSTPLLTGCSDCEEISMVWTRKDGRWQGKCMCGATSWASTWEAVRLDERAGASRG